MVFYLIFLLPKKTKNFKKKVIIFFFSNWNNHFSIKLFFVDIEFLMNETVSLDINLEKKKNMGRRFNFLKMPLSRILVFIFIFFLIIYTMFLVLNRKNENVDKDIFFSFKKTEERKEYSIWPDYLNFVDSKIQNELANNKLLIKKHCLKTIDHLSIELLDKILDHWSRSNHPECSIFYEILTKIYQIQFKHNHLKINEKFLEKVKNMLNNNNDLVNSVYNQVKYF